MIYYLYAAIAAMFAYLAVHGTVGINTISMNKKMHSKMIFRSCMLLSFLSYFIPAAIRYGIGQDYFYTYEPMFNHIVKGETNIYTNEVIRYSEFGFTLLNRFIGLFTNNAQWLFVITSLFCLFLAFKCICDYSVNIPMSVFILVLGSYYLASYSLIRQSMAIVIFLYSLRFIEREEPIKYAVCMFFAFSFHTISLIYIPFYFIARFKFTKKQYVLYSIGIILGLNLFSGVITRIVSLTRFSNRINFNSDYNYLLSIVVFAIFLVAVLHIDDKKNNLKYRIFTNILFVSTCLIGISKFLDTSDRVIFSFYYTNFITIPYILKCGKYGKYKLFVTIGVFFLMAVLWAYEHLYYDQFSILPYVSILAG